MTVRVVVFKPPGFTMTVAGVNLQVHLEAVVPPSPTPVKLTLPKKFRRAVTVLVELAFWPAGIVSCGGGAEGFRHKPWPGEGGQTVEKTLQPPWFAGIIARKTASKPHG